MMNNPVSAVNPAVKRFKKIKSLVDGVIEPSVRCITEAPSGAASSPQFPA
jgi:hypothetical protein